MDKMNLKELIKLKNEIEEDLVQHYRRQAEADEEGNLDKRNMLYLYIRDLYREKEEVENLIKLQIK